MRISAPEGEVVVVVAAAVVVVKVVAL